MGGVRVKPAVLAALLLALAGCNVIGPLVYYTRPRQIQKAEFTFPSNSRVAVFIDPAQSEFENPVFNIALYERLREYFTQYKSRAELVPYRDVVSLRARNPDFRSWSVQRVGREVNADYVLYLRIDSFELRESPDYPLITPQVRLRQKVIAVSHPAADARAWPDDRQGHPVECSRQASEPSSPEAVDDAAAKLGRDTAYFVMMPFFDVDLEETRPVER